MMMTEKYRPKWNEIIGNKKALEKLEKCIKEKTSCILYGESGIGKTSSVYAVAEKLGLGVLETNASDERRKEELYNIYIVSKMRGLRKFLVLLDEVDGIREAGMVVKVLDESKHPVVLTANEFYKISQAIKDKCVEIRFYPPTLTDVLKRVKVIAEKEGVKPRYDQVSRDVRASINTVVYGGEKYEAENDFDKVQAIFTGKPVERVDRQFLIWLLDNSSRKFTGRELFEIIQILSEIDLVMSVNKQAGQKILELIPKSRSSKSIIYPFFLRRLRVMRNV